MRLKKITLNNFRSFKHLEIELHPRVTVLVGENGAGKTTILDGIANALSQILTYLSSANQRLSGRGIEDTDFRTEEIEIRGGKKRWKLADYAQVMAETVDGLQWDVWKPSGSTSVAPDIKYGLSALKKHLTLIYESYKTENPALTPVFAYYGTRRGDIDLPERLRESKENYDFPTSALIGALDSKNDFKEFLKWFDREEAAELRANKQASNDEYRPSVPLEALRATVRTLLGKGYGNPYFNKEHKFVVEPEDGGAPLLVTQLSQGYQSMLALGMDFSRRLALANSHMDYAQADSVREALASLAEQANPDLESEELPSSAPLLAPAIMLVDEIDLHLHPIWQQRVLADLMRAFPNTQFIVTTHSPQVLTSVDASCVRIITEESDPDSGEQKSVAKGITQQTKGVASSDVLFEIMGANPIPPVREAGWFAEYINKIENDTHEDAEGLLLREKLENHFGVQHPLMLDADRLIRFQAFKLRKKAPAKE
jgi:predicted ATP-binding protein involved in virulence